MRPLKKLALIVGGVLAALLVLALLLPLLFRDRIAARLKAEVDAAVDARVSWRSASLGLLRDFPDVSLRLADASIVGNVPFAGDTLLSIESARLVLDLGSVVGHLMRGGRVVVREVVLERPAAALRVLPDGRANWDIVRESAPGERGRDVGVTLRELRITGGRVRMDDARSRLAATVHGLDERLRGDFARERFTLAIRTRADSVSVRFAGIPYLSRVRVSLDADVDADLRENRFTFRNDTLRLNELAVAFAGSVRRVGATSDIDLRFAAPGTSFREILSLIPDIHRQDFASVQTSGTMSLAGRVAGRHGPGAFPAFTVRAAVRDGAFRYPSLPLPARDIGFRLAIDNPGGSADATVVRLDSARATIGRRGLAARMTLRTPVSDPDVELALAGSLDLADLARTVKLEGVRTLAGVATSDVAVRARLSDVDARRFDRVAARGAIHLSRVAVRTDALPRAVAVDSAALRLTPSAAELGLLLARVGGSDVRASGALENLLGYLLRGDDLRGRGSLRSARIDLADWRSTESELTVIPIPPRVDFALDVAVASVVHGALSATGVRGGMRVKDRRATLEGLTMQTMRGAVAANGFYETTEPARPTMDVVMRFDTLDIPTSFGAVVTMQKLAPIARWARGRVSGTLWLRGPLDRNMVPVYAALDGEGAFETRDLSLHRPPILERLGTALSIGALREPSLGVVRGSFGIADGRVTVKPFPVRMAGLDMTVSGSHGIDQTMRYQLGVAIPRTLLAGATSATVSRLATQAGRPAVTLGGEQVVQVAAVVTGTVSEPAVALRFTGVAESAREAVRDVVREQVATRAEDVKQRADSALEEARRRARARADSIVADAERQAEAIRAEARALAARLRAEAGARADSLAARATNPAARIAAQAAADRVRREADQQAERVMREAEARADALVTSARQRAESPG